MSTKPAFCLLAIGILAGFGGCRTAPAPVEPQMSVSSLEEPVILWWSRYAKELENVTHVVNTVWIGDQDDNPDADPDHHQDAWLERGVVPLDWAGGRVYADEGVEALVQRWAKPLKDGYVGIAIDEFGSRDPEVNRVLNEALVLLRERFPGKYIAVWHAGLIDEEAADAYHRAADLVMLELYRSGARFLSWKFGFGLANVRAHGLETKTVVAIGVEDERFASEPAAIRAQIDWLRREADDFAGIGIYASRGGRDLVMTADDALQQSRVR